jgi:hypothetical protein
MKKGAAHARPLSSPVLRSAKEVECLRQRRILIVPVNTQWFEVTAAVCAALILPTTLPAYNRLFACSRNSFGDNPVCRLKKRVK